MILCTYFLVFLQFCLYSVCWMHRGPGVPYVRGIAVYMRGLVTFGIPWDTAFFYMSYVVHMGVLKGEFTDPRHVGGGLAQLCVRVGSHRCETPTLT